MKKLKFELTYWIGPGEDLCDLGTNYNLTGHYLFDEVSGGEIGTLELDEFTVELGLINEREFTPAEREVLEKFVPELEGIESNDSVRELCKDHILEMFEIVREDATEEDYA
jgi:hypothetical protein